MVCDNLGSAVVVVVVDDLDAELFFTMTVGLEGSGFLVAEVVVFLAAEGGRLTSDAKKKKKCIYSSH